MLSRVRTTGGRGHLPRSGLSRRQRKLLAREGWAEVGFDTWRIGGEPSAPRLMALFDEPPCLLLLPPTHGTLVEAWAAAVPSWIDETDRQGLETVTVPVEAAYETCSNCGCPLVPEDNIQQCPNCAARVETADLGEKARNLGSAVSRAESLPRLLAAALALAEPFQTWLAALVVLEGHDPA